MNQRRPVVLIADDDDTNRVLLCDAAEQAGFDVLQATDGAMALATGLTGTFDVALLDVEMPELNGFEVCLELRKRTALQFIPIVMITGHDDAVSIKRAFEAGATDFMSKPLNWPLVPHRLTYILRNAMTEQRVRQMAYYDSLTGMPNRQSFMEFVGTSIAEISEGEGAGLVTVLKIWAAGLERISQSLGREIADTATLNFAGRLLRLRDTTVADSVQVQIARIGGGRFAICLREAESGNEALRLADAVVADFDAPLQLGEHSFFIRPAIGIARFPEHGATVGELMMNAEAAMQQSHSALAPTATPYSKEIGEKSRRLLQLDSELRRAVRDEQLTLHFQPKIRLSDNTVSGVEALLRWFHPDLGSIPPTQFIALAEESGLILELGDWVVRAAFRQLRHWYDAGLDTSIAVNFAGPQFVHGNPARVIADAATAAGVDPNRMVMEITESALIRDLNGAQAGIAAVRALGCRVAVDDFGTGYSSLAYLRGLPADELKVDRAFIQRVDSDAKDAAIYAAVLSLARKLGLSVTAEGVETPGQLAWLRANECAEAQGFLIDKPMPAHEFLKRYGPDSMIGIRVA